MCDICKWEKGLTLKDFKKTADELVETVYERLAPVKWQQASDNLELQKIVNEIQKAWINIMVYGEGTDDIKTGHHIDKEKI